MKVSLIVVQGKPEGKVIPLALPRFRIGRGEECHLRPNNEQISRLHSEIIVDGDRVIVRDMGSRNGTFVNNKRLGPDDFVLSNKDLIQVGPLTFAVSIQGTPAEAGHTPPQPPARAASLDDISGDQIDSWLVGDQEKPVPERPSGIYTGDTMTFGAYKSEGAKSDPNAKKVEASPAATERIQVSAPNSSPEVHEVAQAEEETIYDKLDDEEQIEDSTDPTEVEDGEEAASDDDFIDENNPFAMAKKKVAADAAAGGARTDTAKQSFKDSSTAAEDLLRKMMERRKATR